MIGFQAVNKIQETQVWYTLKLNMQREPINDTLSSTKDNLIIYMMML
jgi:hypothetical protein